MNKRELRLSDRLVARAQAAQNGGFTEEDQRNLLHDFNGAQGSGKLWFGDIFSLVNERTYNNLFAFENLD